MKAEPNFFKVNRTLLLSDRWLSEPFTRGQAWVDLFGLAQHQPSYFRIRGIKINVERGQLAYSQLTLSKRWRWSNKKTIRFLKELEKDGDITQQKSNLTTIISIVKYDFWQGERENSTQQSTQQSTLQKHTYKNDNNDNKIIPKGIMTSPSPVKSQDAQIDTIISSYKKNMGFNPTDRKPRFVAYTLKRNIEAFLTAIHDKRPDLTFDGTLDKTWEWYMKKDDLKGNTLDAFRRKAKMLFDMTLKKEGVSF